MADTTLSFNVLAKDNASRTIAKVGQNFGNLHMSVGKVMKGLIAVGPALAGLAIGAGIKDFINEARESAKVGRLTEAVIKSTGGAAKISAKQVGDLATAISNKTGADDEAVQSGENLLLTFTNIRNGVGKGNQIFDQATQAVTDMTAALNDGQVTTEGIKASSIQLGKALNDPIKGVTALQKVGVSFTADQKKQIKTLVDSGKTMQAQKIILGELNKEFGGAAAAASDPMQKLGVIIGNAKESIGGAFLPIIGKLATILGAAIPAAINKASLGFSALSAAFHGEGVTSNGFVGVMEHIGVAARAVAATFQTSVIPRIKEFGAFVIGTVVPAVAGFVANLVGTFGPAIKDVFGFFKTDVLPRLKEFGTFLGQNVLPKVGQLAISLSKNKDFLVPFAATILTVITAMKAWAVAQGILNVVMSANPIGLVVIAIAALVGGIIYAYKHSEKFRQVLQGAFKGIQAAAQTFAPLVKAAINVVIGVFSLWWNVFAKPILTQFGNMLKMVWGLAVTFGKVVGASFTAIKAPAFAAIRYVINTFLDMVHAVLTGASKAFGWVPNLGGKLKAAAAEFGKFRDSVNAKLSGIQDQQINFSIKYTNSGVNLTTPSSVGRRAGGGPGGKVNGPGTGTSDSVGPYMLSNTEWVIKSSSAQKYGDQAMAAVNNGTATVIPGFAKGGSPGLSMRLSGDSTGLAKSVRAVVVAAASSAAKALAKAGGGLAGTMAFGRSQVGKPYVWGSAGPAGYDCSGFVSALINYARGRNPYRRLGSTGTMPWSDMAPGNGRFMVGWFKGNPGHTAATINGVNFESRGGRGVVVGSAARGANNGLFTNRAKVRGFARGGKVGDLPYDLLDPKGKDYQGSLRFPSYKQGTPWVPQDQLAKVDKGEAILPASVNAQRLKGGTQTVVLEFRSDGSSHMDWLIKEFRKYVRVAGEGDVQKALGVNRR